MSNERITENIVRDALRDKEYYLKDEIIIEEQKSSNPIIQKLLKNASKTGGKGIGKPEFIITSTENSDFLIVFECKSNKKFHQSNNLDNYTSCSYIIPTIGTFK